MQPQEQAYKGITDRLKTEWKERFALWFGLKLLREPEK